MAVGKHCTGSQTWVPLTTCRRMAEGLRASRACGPSSGSLLAVSLSHSQTQCWDCGPKAWLLPQPTSCPGDGDRKLVPVAHAPARQENEGKLAVSGYAGWQTMHFSDHVTIPPFMPGPPRTSLGPFPMTALQRLGTHRHIAQSLLCPIHGIPGLLSHSWSAQFGCKPYPYHLVSSQCSQSIWVSLRLARPDSCQHCRHGLAKAEECRTVTSLLLHTLLLLMQPNVTFALLVTTSHC